MTGSKQKKTAANGGDGDQIGTAKTKGTQRAFKTATGKPQSDDSPRVGLLVGNDVSALDAINVVVKQLIKAGYQPVLFMASHKPSSKEQAHQLELQDLSFYERYLTNNVLYPIIEGMDPLVDGKGQLRDDVLYTPKQLQEIAGVQVETVDDINSKEFVRRIKQDKNMPLVVSCRCYQIAHDDLINAQIGKEVKMRNGAVRKGEIWNLHPGKLPEYRGIFGPIYAMSNLQRTYKWTLHEMVYDGKAKRKGIDAGPIMTDITDPIDYSKPAISLYTDLAPVAGRMLYDRIENFFGGTVPFQGKPQDKFAEEGRPGKYYSHPDQEFFNGADGWSTVLSRLVELGKERGFVDKIDPDVIAKVKAGETRPDIVDPVFMMDHMMAKFRPDGANDRKRIRSALENAVMHWEDQKVSIHAAYDPAAHDGKGLVDAHLLSGAIIAKGDLDDRELEIAEQKNG